MCGGRSLVTVSYYMCVSVAVPCYWFIQSVTAATVLIPRQCEVTHLFVFLQESGPFGWWETDVISYKPFIFYLCMISSLIIYIVTGDIIIL